LIPIGTVYDPFVARGLDALNYACYQDARFMIVGTPSGVTLAPEGGAHQSIGSPLIGMSQDGLGGVRTGLCRRVGGDHEMGV
jgi:pyruvate dehydrogenase E1 component